MWAAFKSDLKEFASGAANETNAVASKVVGSVNILGEGGGNGSDADGDAAGAAAAGGGGVRRDGSVLLANAAYSIGTKGLQGLSSVSSMVGGIVAPRAGENDEITTTNNTSNNNNRGGKSYSVVSSSSFSNNSTKTNNPSSALSSMLAEDDDDDEEGELGWDDEDEELNVDDVDDDDALVVTEGGEDIEKKIDAHRSRDVFEAASDANNALAPPIGGSSSASVDEQVVRALQDKLEMVENCRAELQSEYRRQTAELVELRAKLVEMEQQHQSSTNEEEPVPLNGENTGTNDEVEALQHEIERLKQIFEEQLKDASEEHKQAIAALIQEKETLEKEFHSQQQQNQDLVTEIQTLLELNNQRESQIAGSSNEEQALLHQYQEQIQELTIELAALQANLDDTTAALGQVNENTTMQNLRHQVEMEQQIARTTALEETLAQTKEDHAHIIEEVEESKSKLAEMENVVQVVRTELETKELAFEDRLQVEIARVKISQNLLVLNTSTASSYVTSDDAPRHDHDVDDDDDDDIDDHVNLAALVTTMANMDDNIAKGSHDEEQITGKEVIDLVKSDTKKEQLITNGVVDLVKSDTEEELSDDWGDGGWGDDD